MSRITRDEWGLRLAEATALRSTCLRRSVGCVLLDARGRVLATGYNGPPRGSGHCTPETPCPGASMRSGTGLETCRAIHAEQNAMLSCSDVDKIATCYVTTSPCAHCLKMLMNTRCEAIIFRDEYPGNDHIGEWVSTGREWTCLK